jgi:acetylornithine/succinyldiaminopimelate/putrescine aminotransferase
MFKNQKLSLEDILGKGYIEAVASANEALGEMTAGEVRAIGEEKVDFYPEAKQKKSDEMLCKVGTQMFPAWENGERGAGTNAYMEAAHDNMAPVVGFTNYRIGEDGKLYLIGKSEHYHVPLGHRFSGYRLIENAKHIGVTNATHNNTRGYIVRLAEKRIIQSANGIAWDDEEATAKVLSSKEPKVLNRIINLETGSLSCEAALKMMLARFFRLDPTFPAPKYSGKIPVFFVMGDYKGGLEGNYHGTTVLTQTLRGLWPEFLAHAEDRELYRVVPIIPNDAADFAAKMAKYNEGDYKTAGFLHEIVMMNYGGVLLTEDFLHGAYKLCKETDTPVMCDEIQSCMWYKGMFLFRQYGLHPDFVIIGKGFPGGEYPASKCITTAEMDTLNQFGALVTNGQEELASLAYLVTMNFMYENGDEVDRLGKRFEDGLREIAGRHPDVVIGVEGRGHLAALHFASVKAAAAFAGKMVDRCIDASAQIYKANCVPAMLMKPPVISSDATVDYILSVFESIIA